MFGIPSHYLVVAAVIVAGLAVWKSYDIGYDYANTKCDLAINEIKLQIQQDHDKEIKRLIAANELSQKQQMELVEQLMAKETEIDRIIEENENEASNDADRDNCGLSATGVSRINKIR